MRDLEYENVKSDKIARILGIYTKLMNGGIVNKAEEARQYGVNEREHPAGHRRYQRIF